MKGIKKIVTVFLAMILSFVIDGGYLAKADYPLIESWTTWHTKYYGVGTYTGVYVTKDIAYSTRGASASVQSISVSYISGDGYIEITCTNGTMQYIHVNSITTVGLHPTYNGVVQCFSFKFAAYSMTNNSTYTASGYVYSNT